MTAKQKKYSSLFFPLLIFLIAFLQYANTIYHDYAWDDKLVITGNEYTTRGIKGLYDIFTKRVSVPYKNVYRPIPQALFAIEYDLFHHNPHAAHFFNVLWYGLLCIVVYYFIRFLFPQVHPLFPLLASLLFTVHPLHVEVVANIKSRDEIVALLFGLCAIIFMAKAALKKEWWWFVAGVFSFVIGLLSKENVITLLPVLPLALWYRSYKFHWHWHFLLGVLVLAGVGLGTVYWISHNIATPVHGSSIQLNATVLNNEFLWTTAPGKIVPTALVNVGRYLLLFVYSHPLVHLYGYNQIPFSGWFSFSTWLVAAILLYAAWFVIKRIQTKSPAVFGILFFACTYSIYSNFFVLAPDTMADRYMFFPSLGLVLIATTILFYIASVGLTLPRFSTIRSRFAIALFAIIVTGYFIRTYIANRDWENDFTLIYNRIQYMQNNAAAQATYGLMLYRESALMSSADERASKRSQAMKAFMRSIEIYPDFYWSWISVGKIFTEEGMYQKAELAFLKAQQLEPATSDGYFCLGSLYYTLADSELAITYLEKAVLLDPDIEQSYVMLGKAYLQANNIANLGALAATGLKKFANNAEFDALMASYYFRMDRLKEAEVYIKSALQKDPQNMNAIILRETLPSSPARHN